MEKTQICLGFPTLICCVHCHAEAKRLDILAARLDVKFDAQVRQLAETFNVDLDALEGGHRASQMAMAKPEHMQ